MTLIPMPKTPILVGHKICQHHQCGDDHACQKVVHAETGYQQCHQNKCDAKAGEICGEIPRELLPLFRSAGFEGPHSIQCPPEQVHDHERDRHRQKVVHPREFGEDIKRCNTYAEAKGADDRKSHQCLDRISRFFSHINALAPPIPEPHAVGPEVLHGIH